MEPEGEYNDYHLFGDCRSFLDGSNGPYSQWDMMIAHPPCTYLANSGVRWLYGGKGNIKDEARWEKMCEAAIFFKQLLNSPIERVVIENPIMHKYGMDIIGKRYDQVIQPWMFGHGETKATCLWLKGVDKLTATDVVCGREQRVHRLPPSKDRWKERSRTYKGVADAMANQWG